MSKLMKNMKVRFKRINEDNWITGTLVSRAGKVTGKYPNAWNAKTEEGIIIPVDFDRDISTWEETEYLAMEIREPDKVVVNDILQLQVDEETTKAKERELRSRVDEGVFKEVADNGQHCMTTRWVIKPEVIDGKQSVKARLCARGFEETQDFRTDSPTCTRESIHIALALIASNSWTLN